MMSFLAAYGTVRYNDRHLLVEHEVGPLIITPTQINRRFQPFFVQFRVLDTDGELQPYAVHPGIRVRGLIDLESNLVLSTFYVRRPVSRWVLL